MSNFYLDYFKNEPVAYVRKKYLYIKNFLIKKKYFSKILNYRHIAIPYILVLLSKIGETCNILILYYLCIIFLFLHLFLNQKNLKGLICSIFPSLYLMQQAPQRLGINELYFSLVCLSLWISFIKSDRLFFIRFSLRMKIFFVASLLFLTMNFYASQFYNIPLLDWLRGILPFMLPLLCFPLSKIFRENKDSYADFLLSLFISFFLYSVQVIFIFLVFELYNNQYYIFKNGEYIRIPYELVNQYANETIFYFKKRITTVLAESTSPLVPLGSITGIILFFISNKRKIKIMGLLLTVLSFVSIILTATRSIILCVILVLLFNLFYDYSYYKKYKKKIISGFLIIIATGVITIFSTNTGDVYFNRFSQLFSFAAKTVSFIQEKITPKTYQNTIVSENSLADANITARLDEYKRAYEIFRDNPIIGAGFGVKHAMDFDAGFGNIIHKEVGYVHNWFFYILMCGGIFGLVLYSIIIFYPVLFFLKNLDSEIIRIFLPLILFLILYASFFAVFRLLTFNTLLAVIWATIFYISTGQNHGASKLKTKFEFPF